MKITAIELLGSVALLILVHPLSISAFGGDKKSLLSKVQILTLRKDALATGRRLKPIPQLRVVGGDAKDLYEVEVMQCKNMGSGEGGSEDVQWKCSADIPGYFKLGKTDVVCEGYSSAKDPYILRGSCGVEYTIHLTEAGRARYGKSSYFDSNSRSDSSSYLSTLLIFLALIALIYYLSWYLSNRQNNSSSSAAPRRPARSIFGNYFNNDDDAGGGGPPPPPYSRYDNNNGSGKWFSSTQGGQRREWQQYQQERQWRPGFWSGVGAGAAATALYNRFASPGSSTADMYRNTMFRDNYGSWTTPQRPQFGGRSSWASSSSMSHDRGEDERPSTGFGGTSRR
ncbi:hypothetical protein V1509DRAFT_631790 [Lipomyces kononenkoae]